MNRSLVITRYARTLVKYIRESGRAELIFSEAEALERALARLPDLCRMTEAAPDVVSDFDKKKLLQSALGAPMSPELSRFLSLLNRNGRMCMVRDILRVFVDMYHRSVGLRKVRLRCVVEPSEHLLQRLGALVKQKTGADALFEVEVDPSLVGGFVLDLDDYLLDASIRRQLDRIREQFIERNRRII